MGVRLKTIVLGIGAGAGYAETAPAAKKRGKLAINHSEVKTMAT
ncbi:hypothetical protein [Levilactobacillus sp. HBUAS67488]